MCKTFFAPVRLAGFCLFFLSGSFAQDPTLDAGSKQAPVSANSEVSFPSQARLGNIFQTGETVRIEARIASGDRADWVISDFRGQRVDSGASPVKDHLAAITPHASGNGYYLVRITARSGKRPTGEGQTSYAVVPRIDLSDMDGAKFGVVTHFAKSMSTDILPLLLKAGLVNVRDENPWSRVEKSPGVFDFTVGDNHLTNYMANLRDSGVTPLEVMAFGNVLHFKAPQVPVYQAAPYDQEGYDAYAAYCSAALRQYGSQIKALEIWNEYNGSFCAGPAAADRPRFYTAMLQAAYAKIKAIRPDATVVGGAMVSLPLPYSEKLFQNGALQYMDAIAVHAYKRSPEGVEKQVADLVSLMKKYNHGNAKPVWVTETGTWRDHSVERAEAASYLVRMYTLLLTQPDVARVYWYLARDFEEFQLQGLVHSDASPMGKYTPVALYPAYATLIRQLHGARFVRREQTDPRTRVYQFRSRNRLIWVAWSTSGAATLAFKCAAPLRLIDMVGGERELTPIDGKITLAGGDSPIYVVSADSQAVLVSDAPRRDRVLADSSGDFSSEHGAGNWSYHYYMSDKDGSAAYDPGKVEPMKWSVIPGDWGYRWAGPGNSFQLSEDGGSPSAIGGRQAWAVRRWTSGSAGRIHIAGHAERDSKKGDGSGVGIILDGKRLFTKLLPAGSAAGIDLDVSVTAGSQLDFVLTPGPGLDTSFDSTNFRVTITVEN